MGVGGEGGVDTQTALTKVDLANSCRRSMAGTQYLSSAPEGWRPQRPRHVAALAGHCSCGYVCPALTLCHPEQTRTALAEAEAGAGAGAGAVSVNHLRDGARLALTSLRFPANSNRGPIPPDLFGSPTGDIAEGVWALMLQLAAGLGISYSPTPFDHRICTIMPLHKSKEPY